MTVSWPEALPTAAPAPPARPCKGSKDQGRLGVGGRRGSGAETSLALGARASLDLTSDSNLLHSINSKLARDVGRD